MQTEQLCSKQIKAILEAIKLYVYNDKGYKCLTMRDLKSVLNSLRKNNE